ncbi:MAG: tetraacyldisaccharide 4'-kinase [Candidatus Zixiibacteriota bacterium]|nr:MAG: tetraacyldisaccharide 4'-kinase [candidate division Zixibacteria bacterium]
METVWLKIISNKANPLFWPALAVLAIISWFYRIGMSLKNSLRSKSVRTGAAVVSVGNLTVGGTGKTPTTIFLADYYLAKGKKVGVASSGYGRKNKGKICGAGRDISREDISIIGDELMEMAERLPEVYFAVSKSKTEAALRLDREYRPDIIIIDDGFQHRKLFRSVDILLIDAADDLRGESIFPLGRLREKIAAAARADLIFLTKANFINDERDFPDWLKKKFPDKPTAEFSFINDSLASGENEILLNSISGKSCYFFAGVGNFDGLCNHIKQLLPGLTGWRRFSDHCRYCKADRDRIKSDLEKYRPEYIITTYKDYTKLKDFDFGPPLYYLMLKLQLEEETKVVLDKLDSITENL